MMRARQDRRRLKHGVYTGGNPLKGLGEGTHCVPVILLTAISVNANTRSPLWWTSPFVAETLLTLGGTVAPVDLFVDPAREFREWVIGERCSASRRLRGP